MKTKKHLPNWLHKLLLTTEESKGATDTILDEKISMVLFVLKHIWPDISYIIKKKIKRFFRYEWKKIFFIIFVIFSILSLAYYLLTIKIENDMHITPNKYNKKENIVISYPTDTSMNIRNYLLQIAYGEARYIAHANRPGSQFWGLYQIGENERKLAGYGDISKEVFFNHPEIQDLCMINLLKYNKKYMQKYIDKYSGKIIDGILVTESGILALCQLGCGSAQLYLDSGIIPAFDPNGNQPRQLLKLGGYKLNLNKIKYSIQEGI